MDTKTYALVMYTPLGRRRGSVTLHFSQGSLTGELTLLTRTAQIAQGSCLGKELYFEGELPTLMGTVPYQARGTLDGGSIRLELQTPRGSYPIEGILKGRDRQ